MFSNYSADIAAVIAAALVVSGIAMIYVPAALIVAGLLAGCLSYLLAKGEQQ